MFFQTWSYISFIFGMIIDTGPTSYRVHSGYIPIPVHDLKVKVMDLEFYVKVLR